MSTYTDTRIGYLLTPFRRLNTVWDKNPVELSNMWKPHPELTPNITVDEIKELGTFLKKVRDDAGASMWVVAKILREEHELTERQIARHLGVPRNTLRTHLRSTDTVERHAVLKAAMKD